MRLLRFSILATLALCLSAGSAGADTFPQERTSKPIPRPGRQGYPTGNAYRIEAAVRAGVTKAK